MQADAKTHGLDGTLVEPDWPPLTLEELRGLLRYYPSVGKAKRIVDGEPAAILRRERSGD